MGVISTSGIAEVASNISSISFDSIWSGAAYTSLSASLTNVLNRINVEKGNLEKFSDAMQKLEEYKKIVEQIKSLQERLNSLLGSVDEDDEDYDDVMSAISSLESQIARLENKRKTLKSEIISIISSFVNVGKSFNVALGLEVNLDNKGLFMNSSVPINPIMGTIYNQHEYGNITYFVTGDGKRHTLSSDGCGFFAALSEITAKTGHYFTDEEIVYLVDNVAGGQNGKSNPERMEAVLDYLGDKFGFTYRKGTYNYNDLMSELKNGNGVITMTESGAGPSGHFIPFTNIHENGNVIVNDTSTVLNRDSVELNGFTPNQVKNIVTPGSSWYLDFSKFRESNGIASDNPGDVSTVLLSGNDVSLHNNVPNIYQTDYPDVQYGGKNSVTGQPNTIASAGCGLTCDAMIESYYADDFVSPVDVMNDSNYSGASSGGTGWEFLVSRAKEKNLPVIDDIHYVNQDSMDKVVNYLEDGCVVVANVVERNGVNNIFTDGGHYIVLKGITEDGKILVNDPNKLNYSEYNQYASDILTDGFENGFDVKHFMYGKAPRFLVYAPKDKIVKT